MVRSPNTPWYTGPVLLDHLENGRTRRKSPAQRAISLPRAVGQSARFALPRLCGHSRRWRRQTGDKVRIQPSGRIAVIDRIVTADGDLPEAVPNQSVTLTLTTEEDASRGDVISAADSPAEVASHSKRRSSGWTDTPLLVGRQYLLKLGTRTTAATVMRVDHKLKIDTMEHLAADHLDMNEIGDVKLDLGGASHLIRTRSTAIRRVHFDRPLDQQHPSRRA